VFICFVRISEKTAIFVLYRGADKFLARPDLKKQFKSDHFPSGAEVIAAAGTWLDGQYSDFFFVALSFVAVAFFLPGRAKDLSAPRVRIQY